MHTDVTVGAGDGTIRLRVEIDGDEGAPPLLLLHGITASGRTWDWFLPDLVDRYRVLRLDFRGHGRSEWAAGTYDFPGYVDDAVAVCEQVAGSPCLVVGHSLGGATAATLAQRRPDLVRAVVLEDPPLALAPPDEGNALLDGFRLMRESIPQLQESGITPEVLTGILAASPSATGTTFAELVHPDAITTMAEAMLGVDAAVLDPVLEGTVTVEFDRTRPIPVPTLLITADPASPDAVSRPADGEHLRVTSPGAEVLVMEGAGHLVHDELASRERFRVAVLDFLRRVDGA